MRVSPVGFALTARKRRWRSARRSAEVTHNHPEGIKGAQATAQVILCPAKARVRRKSNAKLISAMGMTSRSLEHIREVNQFNETCQGSSRSHQRFPGED